MKIILSKIAAILWSLIFYPIGYLLLMRNRYFKKKTKIIIFFCTIPWSAFITVVIIIAFTGLNDNEETTNPAVNYEIVEVQDISIFGIKRAKYSVVVPIEIKENQVRPTILNIINKIIIDDKELDEIALFLYSDKEVVGSAFDVAMADWAPNGEWGSSTMDIASQNDRSTHQISISVKENLEQYLYKRTVDEDRFGMTKKERQNFFADYYDAEERAIDEAQIKYPIEVSENIMKNYDYQQELGTRYKEEVIERYGISEDIARKIMIEGIELNWPSD